MFFVCVSAACVAVCAVGLPPSQGGGGIGNGDGNVTLLHSIVANNTAGVRRPSPLAPAIATRRDVSRCAEAHEHVSLRVWLCAWWDCHRGRMVVGCATTTAT